MKVYLHLSIESDAGDVEEIREVITLARATTLTPDRLGLSLVESKQVLQEMQHILVAPRQRPMWAISESVPIVAESESAKEHINSSTRHCSESSRWKVPAFILAPVNSERRAVAVPWRMY